MKTSAGSFPRGYSFKFLSFNQKSGISSIADESAGQTSREIKLLFLALQSQMFKRNARWQCLDLKNIKLEAAWSHKKFVVLWYFCDFHDIFMICMFLSWYSSSSFLTTLNNYTRLDHTTFWTDRASILSSSHDMFSAQFASFHSVGIKVPRG